MRIVRVLAFSLIVVFLVRDEALPNPNGPNGGADVIRGLDQTQLYREENLLGYSVTEHYTIKNSRFQTAAEMTVSTVYNKGAGKTYQVVSRSGSSMLQTRVLDKLLQSESEMSRGDARQRALITSANYEMRPSGEETIAGRRCQILELNPKKKSPYVMQGRAWVDAANYSLVRIQGRPSSSASFWAGRPMITRDYADISGFSLATRSQAISDSVLLGSTDLTIEYTSYQVKTK
jgi:hypothetical protein